MAAEGKAGWVNPAYSYNKRARVGGGPHPAAKRENEFVTARPAVAPHLLRTSVDDAVFQALHEA